MSTLPLKRNRYADPSDDTFECSFASRNLNEDFQTFHLRAARTQRQSLYTPGIAAGLEVSGSPGSSQITIDPGVAIDGQGRLIVLAGEGRADLGLNPPAGEHREVAVPVILDTAGAAQGTEATFHLTIAFSEINRFGEGTDCGRLEQVPWIRLQPTTGDGAFTDDGSAVVLAIVSLDATGQVAALAPQHSSLPRRQPVGQALGALTVQRTQQGDRLQAQVAGRLAPKAGGGLRMSSLDGPLEIAGALQLESGAAVTSFSDDPALSGGDLAVPTAEAVRSHVAASMGQVNTALSTKADRAQVESQLEELSAEVTSQLGRLRAEVDAKANLGGSGTQDFQTKGLQVRGPLTALGTLEVGGDIRLRGSNIRDAGNTPRITVTDNGELQLREDGGNVALAIETDGDVRLGRSSSDRINVRGRVDSTGGFYVGGKRVIDSSASWHRSHGRAGWYNETYKGGWYMTDSTWIRSYNSKNVYCNAVIRADGGLEVHSGGSRRFWATSGGDIHYSGELARLEVKGPTHSRIGSHDLWLGHPARGSRKGPGHRGTLGRALVDSSSVLGLNWDGDWSGGIQYWGPLKKVSSRETKKNIVALSSQDALKTLAGLTPVKFSYRIDPEQKTQLGFIAEDVPDAIAAPDHKSIMDDHIIAVLTKVVQEQQATIGQLSQKVYQMEVKISHEKITG